MPYVLKAGLLPLWITGQMDAARPKSYWLSSLLSSYITGDVSISVFLFEIWESPNAKCCHQYNWKLVIQILPIWHTCPNKIIGEKDVGMAYAHKYPQSICLTAQLLTTKSSKNQFAKRLAFQYYSFSQEFVSLLAQLLEKLPSLKPLGIFTFSYQCMHSPTNVHKGSSYSYIRTF